MDERVTNKAMKDLLEKAKEEGVQTIWGRLEGQGHQCKFGSQGICCKVCAMGPCRILPSGDRAQSGVCGATAETIAARNFLRMIAAGTAAHSDHGRAVAEVFLAAAKGEVPGYGIKDEQKLLQVAMDFGVEVGSRSTEEIADSFRLHPFSPRRLTVR